MVVEARRNSADSLARNSSAVGTAPPDDDGGDDRARMQSTVPGNRRGCARHTSSREEGWSTMAPPGTTPGGGDAAAAVDAVVAAGGTDRRPPPPTTTRERWARKAVDDGRRRRGGGGDAGEEDAAMTAASDAVAIAIILRMRTADGVDDDRVALISCRSSTRREEEGGASWRFGSSPHPRPSPPSFAAAGSPPLFSRNRSDSIMQGDSTYPRGGTMLCLDMEFVAHVVFVLFFLSLGNEHVNSLLTSPPQVNTYIFFVSPLASPLSRPSMMSRMRDARVLNHLFPPCFPLSFVAHVILVSALRTYNTWYGTTDRRRIAADGTQRWTAIIEGGPKGAEKAQQ